MCPLSSPSMRTLPLFLISKKTFLPSCKITINAFPMQPPISYELRAIACLCVHCAPSSFVPRPSQPKQNKTRAKQVTHFMLKSCRFSHLLASLFLLSLVSSLPTLKSAGSAGSAVNAVNAVNAGSAVNADSATSAASTQHVSLAKIKIIAFKTGAETQTQLEAMSKMSSFAEEHGEMLIDVLKLPATPTYVADGMKLHASWFKVQETLNIMDHVQEPDVEWVLTFEVGALSDELANGKLVALITANPNKSVFLKRTGLGFVVAMYKNNQETRSVLHQLWNKRSETGSVAQAFAYHTLWNSSILSKIQFI